ncbi:MAG TPA: hypothetical protein VGU71_10550 [Candidatus Dormibacteraeota bacterium]|nr:hypothetical protein [Candidatus Dormibacteraeota bacterium]
MIRGRIASELTSRWIASLLIYLAISVVIFSSAWVDPDHLSIGVYGDPQMFMWAFNWTPFALSHHLNPFFTDYLNYPTGANELWMALPAIPGLLLAPVQRLFGPVVAYDLLMTLAPALSAWLAQVVIARLVRDRLAAFFGGLLYGFSPYMLAHALAHANFVIAVFPPLAMLLLADLFVWQRHRPWVPGSALGLLAAAQLLTCAELLLTTVATAVIGLVLLAAVRRHEVRKHLPNGAAGIGFAAAVALPVAAYPLYFQFFGPLRISGTIRPHDFYVTDITNFFVPTSVIWLAPHAAVELTQRWTGNIVEWNGYVGLPLIAILAFTAYRWRSRPLVIWSTAMCVGIALLSLGPHAHIAGRTINHLPLPWLVAQSLPLFDNVLPARLMLFFFLTAGILLAFFIAELRASPGVRGTLFWTSVVAALLLLVPRLPWPATSNPVPVFFTEHTVQLVPEGSVALVAPFATNIGYHTAAAGKTSGDAMTWQMVSGMRFRMPEGYVEVPGPNGKASLGGPLDSLTESTMLAIQDGASAPTLTDNLRSGLLADLTRWKVRTVIVGPMANQGEMVRLFASLLEREPEAVGGVFVWWDVQT